MNYDQLTGVVRAIVPALVAYVVGKGWIPAGAASDVAAAIMAVLAAVWSVKNNAPATVIATVANMPEVKKVVTDNVTANTGPLAAEPKVVSS